MITDDKVNEEKLKSLEEIITHGGDGGDDESMPQSVPAVEANKQVKEQLSEITPEDEATERAESENQQPADNDTPEHEDNIKTTKAADKLDPEELKEKAKMENISTKQHPLTNESIKEANDEPIIKEITPEDEAKEKAELASQEPEIDSTSQQPVNKNVPEPESKTTESSPVNDEPIIKEITPEDEAKEMMESEKETTTKDEIKSELEITETPPDAVKENITSSNDETIITSENQTEEKTDLVKEEPRINPKDSTSQLAADEVTPETVKEDTTQVVNDEPIIKEITPEDEAKEKAELASQEPEIDSTSQQPANKNVPEPESKTTESSPVNDEPIIKEITPEDEAKEMMESEKEKPETSSKPSDNTDEDNTKTTPTTKETTTNDEVTSIIELEPGIQVTACDLKGQAALNGKRGIIKGRQGDRIVVIFPEPFGEKALRPLNIKPYNTFIEQSLYAAVLIIIAREWIDGDKEAIAEEIRKDVSLLKKNITSEAPNIKTDDRKIINEETGGSECLKHVLENAGEVITCPFCDSIMGTTISSTDWYRCNDCQGEKQIDICGSCLSKEEDLLINFHPALHSWTNLKSIVRKYKRQIITSYKTSLIAKLRSYPFRCLGRKLSSPPTNIIRTIKQDSIHKSTIEHYGGTLHGECSLCGIHIGMSLPERGFYRCNHSSCTKISSNSEETKSTRDCCVWCFTLENDIKNNHEESHTYSNLITLLTDIQKDNKASKTKSEEAHYRTLLSNTSVETATTYAPVHYCPQCSAPFDVVNPQNPRKHPNKLFGPCSLVVPTTSSSRVVKCCADKCLGSILKSDGFLLSEPEKDHQYYCKDCQPQLQKAVVNKCDTCGVSYNVMDTADPSTDSLSLCPPCTDDKNSRQQKDQNIVKIPSVCNLCNKMVKTDLCVAERTGNTIKEVFCIDCVADTSTMSDKVWYVDDTLPNEIFKNTHAECLYCKTWILISAYSNHCDNCKERRIACKYRSLSCPFTVPHHCIKLLNEAHEMQCCYGTMQHYISRNECQKKELHDEISSLRQIVTSQSEQLSLLITEKEFVYSSDVFVSVEENDSQEQNSGGTCGVESFDILSSKNMSLLSKERHTGKPKQTWSESFKGNNITLSTDCLTCHGSRTVQTVLGSLPMKKPGLYYWEILIKSDSSCGAMRVGLARNPPHTSHTASLDLNSLLGSNQLSWGWYSTGSFVHDTEERLDHNNTAVGGLKPLIHNEVRLRYSAGDFLGFRLDCQSGELHLYKNRILVGRHSGYNREVVDPHSKRKSDPIYFVAASPGYQHHSLVLRPNAPMPPKPPKKKTI